MKYLSLTYDHSGRQKQKCRRESIDCGRRELKKWEKAAAGNTRQNRMVSGQRQRRKIGLQTAWQKWY